MTRIAAAALAVAIVLAGGWVWLRDASVVKVREVFITGLSSSEEPQIRQALRIAAADMTTLHVREDALRAAVRAYPSVAGIEVDADFPHKLSIEVLERTPVAALDAGGRRVPASGDGLLLRGMRASDLPVLRVRSAPPGARVTDKRVLGALGVAGVAPGALRSRITRLRSGPRGLTLDLRNGPDLVFGSRRDAGRKWAAAVRVLADPSAAGATYLDLRVPERVAAGGLGPVEEEHPEAPSSNPQPEPQTSPSLNP
ncbi:MAG: FtsQ-type POTRA domain-containing protein [Actinomycetota bacterium]|nr:FtsQ-type POTRA domain-containing protein [Actinomycetota bacterium]